MNHPNQAPELRSGELLDALQRHRVQFVVVGGFAAQLHGATRQTKDLDLCPAPSEDNLDRLAAALQDLAARLRLPPELRDVEVPANGKLLREIPVTHWRTRAGDIDVLHAISGTEWSRSATACCDRARSPCKSTPPSSSSQHSAT